MKRNLSLLLATILLSVTVAGCGGAKESAETSTAQTEAAKETAEAETEAEPEEDPAELIEAALTEGLDYFYARNGKEVDDEKALAAFQTAADLGDAGALYYIGRLHDRKEEYEDAAAAYEKAIAGGSSMAKLALGLLYQDGDGVEEDFAKARQLFEEAIAEGCVEANVGLGDIYQSGYGEEAEDAAKAIEYFELATTGQEPEWLAYAYGSLAYMYSGAYDGVEKDLDKIAAYGEKTAAISDAWSGHYLKWMGDAYRSADEYISAMEWYQKAANLGNTDAMNVIGLLYYEGQGVEQDYTAAMEWYQKAADLENVDAMYNIGILFKDGLQDYAAAMEWFQKAANLGDEQAMNQIGWFYHNGFGVEQDYATAMEWYEKGAALDNPDCMDNIGTMFRDGLGVEVDYEKAMEWYEKGVVLDDPGCMNKIGVLYFKGLGVETDYEKALEWFGKSADLGDETAINNIKYMSDNGMVSKEAAAQWLN